MSATTTDRANGLIVTSLAVSSALVLIRDAQTSTLPAGRFIVGTAVAGVGLAVTAQFAPELAGGLAVLLLASSALVYGGPAWSALADRVTPATAPTAPPARSQPA